MRAAHRHLVRALHPDRLGGLSEADRATAEEHLVQVNLAWSLVGTADARAEYDRVHPFEPAGAGEAPAIDVAPLGEGWALMPDEGGAMTPDNFLVYGYRVAGMAPEYRS